MRPNYCSGGTLINGRLSSLNHNNNIISNSKKSIKLANECAVVSKNAKAQLRLGARRQNQQQPQQLQQKEEQSRDSSFLYDSPSSPNSSTTTRPSSPFIVYRSAKYGGTHARLWKTIRGYAKYYVLLPIALFANQCKDVFYQVCGLLLLLVTCPLWMLIIIGLFVVRRLRLLLIQRLYPGRYTVDDYINSYKYCGASSSESLGANIVNSLVWTKGKLDVETIRKRFKLIFSENPYLSNLLRLKQVSKFGATLWENCGDDFNLDNHIVEAPKKFHSCPIVDEPLKELYRTGSNKSILQKYVSYCVSMPLEQEAPPWKIHVVSYISREDGIKEKACLVIRMHVALINNRNVRKALRELFMNSVGDHVEMDVLAGKVDENSKIISKGALPGLEIAKFSQVISEELVKGDALKKSFWSMGNLRQGCIGEKIKEISTNHQKNFGVWINLRLKQLEFHSKTFVMSIILVDIRDTIKRCVASFEVLLSELWESICCFVLYVVMILQATAAVPMIMLSSLIRRKNFDKLGLQIYPHPGKRLISWSDLLHGDLIEEICSKVGTTSPGNVIMMACSYALRDYYQQNNIPHPQKLGFIVGNASNDFLSSMSLKAIPFPCNSPPKYTYSQKTTQEIQYVDHLLQKYPKWKVLGLWYTLGFTGYILPTYLARKIQRRIVSCYPFSFTHVNMNSTDSTFLTWQEPIHQVYGEVMEEFSFWQMPPLSDFGVSITTVQYSGKTRLFVMSPFQSMDTVLTQRCNQYLIKIAEDVGVERSRIPYSRRSSPTSTSCSTPQNLSFIFNNLEKSSLELKEKV